MSAWPPRDGGDSGPVRRSSLREMQQPWRARPATVSGGTGTAPVALSNLAYGYGLGIRQTCDYRQIVSHSGGLPGFGSQMRWLVDEGIGLIAMGNLTYTGWGGVLDQATDILAKTGGVTRRMPIPSAALVAAKNDAPLRHHRDTRWRPNVPSTCSWTNRIAGAADERLLNPARHVQHG